MTFYINKNVFLTPISMVVPYTTLKERYGKIENSLKVHVYRPTDIITEELLLKQRVVVSSWISPIDPGNLSYIKLELKVPPKLLKMINSIDTCEIGWSILINTVYKKVLKI